MSWLPLPKRVEVGVLYARFLIVPGSVHDWTLDEVQYARKSFHSKGLVLRPRSDFSTGIIYFLSVHNRPTRTVLAAIRDFNVIGGGT